MARTIKEIKDSMTGTFVNESAVVTAYGLNTKKTFDQQFSSVSIESILFYCFAFAVWTLETLFDKHKAEVEAKIEQLEPHTLRWYVNKAKAFMYGYKLVQDTDYYDTSNMSETDIEAARRVKYAVATESNTVVYLKVAGQNDKQQPCLLTRSELDALTAYMNTIKDAGVAIKLINEEADQIKIHLKVYYDATVLDAEGVNADGNKPVEDAVRSVITNLPFNGVYRNTDLLAAITKLPGVEVADIVEVSTKVNNAAENDYTKVVGFDKPYSGYYSLLAKDLIIDYVNYSVLLNPQTDTEE